MLLSGYYGFGNAGDEAVLAGAVRTLRDAIPGVQPLALSARPAVTEDLHGIEARPRWGPGALLSAIRSVDLVLSGGGSLLQDRTSVASLLYYLGVLRLARLAGRRTMVFAQGIGPLKSRVGRRLVAGALRRVDAIVVRDEDSAALVRALHVRRPVPVVGADSALALGGGTPASRLADGGRAIGLALRGWPGGFDVAANAARLCDRLALEADITLIPMQEPMDRQLAAAIESAAGTGVDIVPPDLPPSDLLDRFHELDAVIAMRLHALIFAAAQSIPCVALSYDPKVDAFMRTIGRSEWVLPFTATAEQAADRVLESLQDGRPYPPGLLDSLRAKARVPARVAARLLSERR